eukprot:1158040-Pelagomonas_calceolata.AAC.9
MQVAKPLPPDVRTEPPIESTSHILVRPSSTEKGTLNCDRERPPAACAVQVAMVKPQPFDKKRLSKFLRLSSYPDSMQGVVPLMYPICESFRLNIQVRDIKITSGLCREVGKGSGRACSK